MAKSQPYFFQSVGKIKSLVSQFPPNQDSCLWSSIFLWLFVDCPLLWDVLKVVQGESFGALLRTYHLHSHRCKGESTHFNIKNKNFLFQCNCAIERFKQSRPLSDLFLIQIFSSFKSFPLSDLFLFQIFSSFRSFPHSDLFLIQIFSSFRSSKFLSFHQRLTD